MGTAVAFLKTGASPVQLAVSLWEREPSVAGRFEVSRQAGNLTFMVAPLRPAVGEQTGPRTRKSGRWRPSFRKPEWSRVLAACHVLVWVLITEASPL